MIANERIVAAAWGALKGEYATTDDEPGFCLAWVREVIEHAMRWPSHAFYDGHVTEWVQPDGYDRANGHWARDAERSLRNLRMAVREEEPGDLLFNHRAAWSDRWGAYIGHVAILVAPDLIAENVHPAYRPGALTRGALALTPRDQWATPTTIVRFEP